MERAASKLMQLAKRRLMIQKGPTASKDAGRAGEDEATASFERSIHSLARLIKICNAKGGGSSGAGLQFNQAQCRLLDLQGFHDNIQNLVDGMAALGGPAATGGRLAVAAIEVARVTANAEALVFQWSASPLADVSYSSVPLAPDAHWLVHAMASGCDGGMAAAQQHHDQQWCIAVMEVLLAQLRATLVDVGKQTKGQRTGGSGDGHRSVPFWMVERTFEIVDEYLSLDVDDRGLSMAVRLDHRRMLDRLVRLTRSRAGLRRISNQTTPTKLQDVIVRFLVMKLEDAADGDYDGGIESYIERIHQREPWAAVYRSRESKEPMGGGSFGMVHVSDWLGMPAAVKIIPAVASVDDFWNEVSVLAAVNHPRLVSLLFAAVDNDGDNECRLWTELLGPDLGSILLSDAQKQPLSITVAVELILQVAEGMAYLHKKGILHRSLKTTNVLLVPPATATIRRRRARALGNLEQHHLLDEFTRIKLADYGLPKTKFAGSMAMSSLSSTSSQVRYCAAPELDEKLDEPKFTRKTDVYDFGMLCYVIFSRSLPSSKAKPDIFAHTPTYLAAFIQSCWNQDPQRRPTFETICSFFKSLKSLLIRGGADGRLPFTPSDLVNLRAAGLGLGFFVDAALLSRSRQPDEDKAAFPMDPFVLWLSTSMDQLEREEGFATAAEMAGDFAANWAGEKHEFEQAVFWYHKSSSSSSPSASMILDRPSSPESRLNRGGAARWKLGLCLELGLGIAKDERRAVILYKQAAREGFASAHVELGRCYQSGRGVQSTDADKAVSHFAKALELFESSFSEEDDLRSTRTMMTKTTPTVMQAQSLACIEFYMNILAKGRRDEDCGWAGDLLHEVAAKSRVGRRIVAGRGCCNVRELVAMLGDWSVRDVGRRRAKLVLEKLAMEDDILQQALLA